MKSFALITAALVLGFTLVTGDAEAARRLGGGMSSGMQRQAISPQKAPNAAPAPTTPAPSQATAAAKPQTPAAPAAQPKRSWLGPLAGLAAGIGLAALASHFGFGEELASMMMIGLLIMAVLFVVGMFMRRRAATQQPALAGVGGMPYGEPIRSPEAPSPAQFAGGDTGSAAPHGTAQGGRIPADFDQEGFLRNAKVNFIRLQAANDAGNLDDIREFTTPEMFAEIKLNFGERGAGSQETDVVKLDGAILDVSEEGSRYIVSVRFQGLIREDKNAAAEPFDEIWHLVKPRDGSRGWVLAGIQQVS